MKTALVGVLGLASVACGEAPAPVLAEQVAWSNAQQEALLNDPELNPLAHIAIEAKTFLQRRDGSRLALGSICFAAPARPPAWYAVKDLIAAGRTEYLLELADSAPTNEGRLWAVYGLVRSKKLDAYELVARAAVISAPIWTCEGCLSRQVTPTEAIELLPALD